MAIVLVINPGSSSKKYALYKEGRPVVVKHFEREGERTSVCTIAKGERGQCLEVDPEQFRNPLRRVVDDLFREGYITNLHEIERVGLRIVAPGTGFQRHAVINDVYIHDLRTQEAVAPLHVPPTLIELESVQRELPKSVLVGASDSAFHATMPDQARRYSIERADAERYDIHRFGYHGLSVASVVRRLESSLGCMPRRALVCHVGSGVSITALKDGKSIDTSMGFSPASGLVMSTRAGDLDPGAVLELMRAKNMRIFDMQTYLNTRGGLYGVAGDGDLRIVLDAVSRGEANAKEALELFVYQFQKQIGSYYAILGGLDAVVVTATAAERNPVIRSKLFSTLEHLGIHLDEMRNETLVGKEGVISTTDSPVKVAVVRTDEMGEIARIATELPEETALPIESTSD